MKRTFKQQRLEEQIGAAHAGQGELRQEHNLRLVR